MLLATTLEELSGGELEVEDLTQVEFALFCGICNGAIEVVASVPDMIRLLVGAFNEDKRAEFFSLLDGLKTYQRFDEDGIVVATGAIAAIKDALSEQFNLETPCFFAHNVTEIGIGIVVGFVSGGTTLGSSIIGRFAGTFVRVIKYFDDLAALPFTMLAKFTGSTCRFFYQQANQLLYEINETIFRASLIIDGRIHDVELAVNSVIVKQNIISQPDGSLILKVDGNPSLPPEGAPFAFTRSTKLIAEGIGISEALLLRFREAGIGDHVVKQLKDGFDPTTLDEIIPIFESSDLTKALNQKLADDFVKDIDNFGREIVGRPELVRAWERILKAGNVVSEILRKNATVLEYIAKNDALILQSAIDDMISNINYPIKEILTTDGARGMTILLERGGKQTNKAIIMHPTIPTGFKTTVLRRTYNPRSNPSIPVELSDNLLVPDYRGTKYLHPDTKDIEIRIELSGNRDTDFARARAELKRKLGLDPNDSIDETDYTWHHFDDVTEENGKLYSSMQLVETKAHGGAKVQGMAHSGSVAQYRAIKGAGY